jgi:preprotein translocase subunit Sec63
VRNSFYLLSMALFLRFLILAVVVYFLFFRKRKPRRVSSVHQENGPHGKDPYEILGVRKGTSQKEIKKAYHRALASYHPDKVEHLGVDLQKLAKERTQEIMKAYQSISR